MWDAKVSLESNAIVLPLPILYPNAEISPLRSAPVEMKRKQCLELDFDRQTVIGNYIVDFYCKPLGIVIEIDGKSHQGREEYDRERDDYLKGLGLEIIRIPVVRIFRDLKGLMEELKEELRKHM